MRRILIATEGSTVSGDAVREFAKLFGAGAAELFVLSVCPAGHGPEVEACQDALDLAIADLRYAGHDAIGLMRTGAAAETIVAVAKELGVSLIVLGTHDRQGLERLLHGSVAEDVLHGAPCAVFIYPHPRRELIRALDI